MKFLLAVLTFATVLALLVFGIFIAGSRAVFIIGGEYTVPSGRIIQGDLVSLFAHVTLEEGAQVNGKIHTFSSDLIVDGKVSHGIFSLASQVIRSRTAQILESVKEIHLVPCVLLLPQIARLHGSAVAQ